MEAKDWIMISISVVIGIGGFLGTIIVAILGWLVKRLIASIDKLETRIQSFELELNQRPDWNQSGDIAVKKAREMKLEHENEHHRTRRNGNA